MSTLEGQLRRVYAQYREQANDLRKWVYLANLRDRNEVLFYRLLSEHISEMLPVVYTPTVGPGDRAVQPRVPPHPRGVPVGRPPGGRRDRAAQHRSGPDDVDLLVATDSEGILGIGDQGVGGIEISIGKLAVYTAAAGIHPRRVLPVVLDMGTDNLKLLNDDMYLGERHARVRDQRYDDLIDAYVTAVSKLFPNAMLHWEDFGATNARRILNKYADQVCTFNDDMQGTAAVVLAAVFSAVRAAGTADARPAGRDPRRRHRRARHRRHDARSDGPRGPVPRGGHPPVLPAGPQRAADRRRPDRAPAATSSCPTPDPRAEVAGWGVGRERGRVWPRWSGTCTRRC